MNRVDIKNMCKIINKHKTLQNPHLHHLSRVKKHKEQNTVIFRCIGEKKKSTRFTIKEQEQPNATKNLGSSVNWIWSNYLWKKAENELTGKKIKHLLNKQRSCWIINLDA